MTHQELQAIREGVHEWSEMCWTEDLKKNVEWVDGDEIEASIMGYIDRALNKGKVDDVDEFQMHDRPVKRPKP